MKDSRLKYVELFQSFHYKASEIRMACKMSQRACEALARRVGSVKARNAGEFEKIEKMKEFITTTSVANEKMIDMLAFVHEKLSEIASDCSDLLEIAKLKDTLKFQSDTITLLIEENKNITAFRNELRDNIRKNQATA